MGLIFHHPLALQAMHNHTSPTPIQSYKYARGYDEIQFHMYPKKESDTTLLIECLPVHLSGELKNKTKQNKRKQHRSTNSSRHLRGLQIYGGGSLMSIERNKFVQEIKGLLIC